MVTAFAFSTENWKRDAHEVSNPLPHPPAIRPRVAPFSSVHRRAGVPADEPVQIGMFEGFVATALMHNGTKTPGDKNGAEMRVLTP